MNFSPGNQQSYRLGDHTRGPRLPDGTYVGVLKSFEASTSKTGGKPQIKGTFAMPNSQTHTFWYNCWYEACFRLFDDLINLGMDPNTDMGPPTDMNGQNRWVPMLAPHLLNKGFQFRVETRSGSDFPDTYLEKFLPLGPDGSIQGAPQPAATAPAPAPAPAADPFGAPAPVAAAGTVDVGAATQLFRGQ